MLQYLMTGQAAYGYYLPSGSVAADNADISLVGNKVAAEEIHQFLVGSSL
jgi:hypothetical protein